MLINILNLCERLKPRNIGKYVYAYKPSGYFKKAGSLFYDIALLFFYNKIVIGQWPSFQRTQ